MNANLTDADLSGSSLNFILIPEHRSCLEEALLLPSAAPSGCRIQMLCVGLILRWAIIATLKYDTCYHDAC
jgi:hypothetical protein